MTLHSLKSNSVIIFLSEIINKQGLKNQNTDFQHDNKKIHFLNKILTKRIVGNILKKNSLQTARGSNVA